VKDSTPADSDVVKFVLDEIDSVPHLEALLLLWNSRPALWTPEELAHRLYVKPDVVRSLLQDLVRQGLIGVGQNPDERYRYTPVSDERDRLIGRLDATYRREVVRVSTMIHSKPSSAIRDFARAFRFTKERE